MTITTHDQHAAQFLVPYDATPKRDHAKIAAYLKLRAERARRAKLFHANSTGPRPDEKYEVTAVTIGPTNPEAAGPVGKPYEEIGGHWERYGMNGVERWVPDPAPVSTRFDGPSVPVKAEPEPKYEGWLTGTSAIGAKPKNKYAASPCGPHPQEGKQ